MNQLDLMIHSLLTTSLQEIKKVLLHLHTGHATAGEETSHLIRVRPCTGPLYGITGSGSRVA
jgi:hypothetical protein